MGPAWWCRQRLIKVDMTPRKKRATHRSCNVSGSLCLAYHRSDAALSLPHLVPVKPSLILFQDERFHV